jgi:pyruvate,water dikinase
VIRWLFRLFARAAVFVFFRRVEVEGAERVPSSGPVLLVSNHTNALVDPLIVMIQLRRPVTLTAKSTLRRDPLLGFLMRALRIVAFHRRQDAGQGAETAKNFDALAECRLRLGRGEAILVFPEGVSHSDPQMRSFKTGAARLALDSCRTPCDGLKIVPVGLYFEQKDRLRSTVWVRFGESIDVGAWRQVHPEGDAGDLTARLEREVRAITLNFERHADSELFLWTAALLATRGTEPRPLGQDEAADDRIRLIHRLQRGYEPLRELDAERLSALERRVAGYRRKLRALGISPAEVFLPIHAGRALFFLLRELEIVTVGLPVALWGFLNHVAALSLVRRATRKLSKDQDHVASNAIFLSLPVFPLFYAVQAGVVAGLAGPGWALLYLVSLPYSGAVAVLYRDRVGGAWQRIGTFLRFLANRRIQERLVAEGRNILTEIEHGGRAARRAARHLVLPFEDPLAAELAVCGGKGSNLARLTQAGFPVPRGVTVTAAAYRTFLAADAGWSEAVAALDFTDPERLRRQCVELRERLARLPLPPELVKELEEGLPALLEKTAVSVRSSSTLEDLAGAAFAGQHDTYLNVTTVPAVLDALRRCFASLWEDRAARYRYEKGFGQAEAAMAVVVQAMVESEAAGVAFSLHPVSGNLDQLLVNASFGLGETVVSGEGEVDQFVVDKKSGEIVERQVAAKTHALSGAAGGGTRRQTLGEVEQRRPSLTDGQIAELRRLCVRVEDHYAFPQDVEWAFAGGRIHLLQSRPVSSIPPRWTRDESAERFPNVMTPLTWDFTSDGFHESLRHSLALMGLPAFPGKWFDCFESYVFGNQNAVRIYTSDQQVAFSSLEELAALLPIFQRRYTWVQELPVNWLRDLDGYLFTLGRLSSAPLGEKSEVEVWRHLLEIDRLGREYFRPNIAISITQGALHRMLFQTLALLVGAEEAPALYDALTCFCETKTGLVNRDLYRLYELARADAMLTSLLIETDRRRIWLEGGLSAHPAFADAFDRFLRNHGHREVDFDAYHPTWSGQPWVVMENLRLMLMRDEVEDPSPREHRLRARQQAAEQRYLALAPERLGYFAAELLRLARAYTALDDLEHYQTTRLTVPFRATLVELGRRLADRGVLDEAEDAFFLHKATLSSVVEGTVSAAAGRAEAERNKAEYLARRRVAPPHVYGEEPQAEAGDLRGLPGSRGVAEGPVCRVYDSEDFARFRAGSVLVARTTNPAWTPLFYSACAVVTESGGPLSHGAVTAREVGLPAVMSVRGALDLLEDGERVRVNGTAGTVDRLS